MLTALPDEVRGLVGALDRAAALRSGDVGSEAPSDMTARREPPGGQEPAQPESLHDAGASGDELPTMDDPQSLREADALERALKRWKQGMQERAENPRISLSVSFFFRMAKRSFPIWLRSTRLALREPIVRKAPLASACGES